MLDHLYKALIMCHITIVVKVLVPDKSQYFLNEYSCLGYHFYCLIFSIFDQDQMFFLGLNKLVLLKKIVFLNKLVFPFIRNDNRLLSKFGSQPSTKIGPLNKQINIALSVRISFIFHITFELTGSLILTNIFN